MTEKIFQETLWHGHVAPYVVPVVTITISWSCISEQKRIIIEQTLHGSSTIPTCLPTSRLASCSKECISSLAVVATTLGAPREVVRSMKIMASFLSDLNMGRKICVLTPSSRDGLSMRVFCSQLCHVVMVNGSESESISFSLEARRSVVYKVTANFPANGHTWVSFIQLKSSSIYDSHKRRSDMERSEFLATT
jgi:hypothetical protein